MKLLVVISALSLLSVAAAADEKPKGCSVRIITPQRGDKVGKEGKVTGFAKLPPGSFLWVLSHRKDLAAEWWPQMGRPAVIQEDDSWVIITGYGRQEDIKEDFEVAVVVVDANTNNQLRDWFKTAKQKDFPPVDFPTTIDDCPAAKITVTKTSH